MPLTWSFPKGTGIHPDLRDTLGADQRYGVLIRHMYAVGIRTVTEKNVVEFARRVAEYERVIGYGWGDDKGPVPYELEDCKKLIGLGTNITEMSKKTFDAWMAKEDAENKRYAQQRAREEKT